MKLPNDESNTRLINDETSAMTNSCDMPGKTNDWTDEVGFAKLFNMTTAKLCSCILVVLFFLYHGYLNSHYGRTSCNRLLHEGHILGYNEWQPTGCMIHTYRKDDIETCYKYVKYYNKHNSFIFIGDTRMKQIYDAFILQLDSSHSSKKSDEKPHQTNNSMYQPDLIYTNEQLDLEISFYFKSVMDESLINLVEYIQAKLASKTSFLIIGTLNDYLTKNFTSETFETFKGNLSNLVDVLKTKQPYDHSQQDMTSSTLPATSLSVYWMLQDPIDEVKYSIYLATNESTTRKYLPLTNKQIDLYNRAAMKLLYYSPIEIWSSSRLVSQGFNSDSANGFDLGAFSLETNSQILYNLYCNDRMKFNDASCCSQPESLSLIQQITFSLFLISFFITVGLFVYRLFWKNGANFRFSISGSEISLTKCKNAASSNNVHSLFSLISRLAIIMLYFFLCDRANFFMKENKHFTYMTFFVPLIYFSVLGIFFSDITPTTKPMNRYQTDEIKGFMQLVILIYQLSGAQKNTSIYLYVRLFTSAYLFLSGYGHFTYFWLTANYSLPRFFSVLFRLNFLPILLCFTMSRMYQFYSFIPLVTFWYVCCYLIMAIFPRVSAKSAKENGYHYFYIIIKLALLFAFITTLNLNENLFERMFMFKPWKFLFISYDVLVSEWRTRWSRDCYSFALGMLFGLSISLLKRLNVIDDSESSYDFGIVPNSPVYQTNTNDFMTRSSTRSTKTSISFRLKISLVILSTAGLAAYACFAYLCLSRENCNQATTYVTIIPIISYVILRNTLDSIKLKFSLLFKWLGSMSLELFVCSFHILLASDSNGILVLLPGQPVLNMMLTTFIFVCVSHELNVITQVLSGYMVPNNWRLCLRNFCSFLILLMPIAIKYGYI